MTHLLKCLIYEHMSRVMRKLDIMNVRIVSFQISLCSPHRLIRDESFRPNWIFAKKRHHLNEKFHKKKWKSSSLISLCGLHRLIWDDNLRTSIMPSFLRTRHIYSEEKEFTFNDRTTSVCTSSMCFKTINNQTKL